MHTYIHASQWGQLVVTIPEETKNPNPTRKNKKGKTHTPKKNPKVEGKQKKLQQTPQTFDGN